MTMILFIATLVLNVSGALFAGVYLWINLSGKYMDLTDRNDNVLKITRVSLITSLAFAFLSCLLEDFSLVDAVSRTALLYSVITITWLVVIVVCGIVMLLTVISKERYSPEVSRAVKRLFKIALPGAIFALILTWLFS